MAQGKVVSTSGLSGTDCSVNLDCCHVDSWFVGVRAIRARRVTLLASVCFLHSPNTPPRALARMRAGRRSRRSTMCASGAAYQRKCGGYSSGRYRRRGVHRVSQPSMSSTAPGIFSGAPPQMVQKRTQERRRVRRSAQGKGRRAIVAWVVVTRRVGFGGDTSTARVSQDPPPIHFADAAGRIF